MMIMLIILTMMNSITTLRVTILITMLKLMMTKTPKARRTQANICSRVWSSPRTHTHYHMTDTMQMVLACIYVPLDFMITMAISKIIIIVMVMKRTVLIMMR